MTNDKLIATRFPEKLVEQLDEVARHEDRSRSQILRKICRNYVSSFNPARQNDFAGTPFGVVK
jgi:metal-responsive CopG/Arc/MetJ family transcriptional regulator